MLNADIGFKVLYDVTDASWKPDEAAVCNIIVSANHVVIVVFDSARKRFVSLYCAETGSEEEKTTLINDRFSKTNPGIYKQHLFLSVQKTMLIPAALYDRENRENFLEKQHKKETGEIISDYPVKMIDAQMAYLYPESFNLLKINVLYANQDLMPIDAAWLDGLYLNYKNNDEIHTHININDGFISIAVFKDGGLQFYNTFDTATAEEVLYFVMFVSEQLHINAHRDSYYYSGFIRKGDEAHTLLSKYIKTLKPEERPGIYNYSMPVLDAPGYMFFNVFCTPICES